MTVRKIQAVFLLLCFAPLVAAQTVFHTRPIQSWTPADIASIEIRLKGRLSTDPAATTKIIKRVPVKTFDWVMGLMTARFTVLVPANQTWEIKALEALITPVNTTGFGPTTVPLQPLPQSHFPPPGQMMAIDVDLRTGTVLLGPATVAPPSPPIPVVTPPPPPPPSSTTLQIGPTRQYKTIAAALAVAQSGSTIEIDAGVYPETLTIAKNNLTLRGIGGYAHLKWGTGNYLTNTDTISNGKALLIIAGSGTVLENMEFSGAKVVDENGAGIRYEGGSLTIRGSYFHDNENGLLGNGGANDTLLVEHSVFERNGQCLSACAHNIYVGNMGTFIFRHSKSVDPHDGHALKSRARVNQIVGNYLSTENSDGSYEANFPNGGTVYFIGNVVVQGANTGNSVMLAYGEEGASNPNPALYAINNTFYNKRGSGLFMNVIGALTLSVLNNVLSGGGTFLSGGTTDLSSNLALSDAAFVNVATNNYRLLAGAAAIDAGVAPGLAGAFDLTPAWEYVDPAGKQARVVSGARLDVGAYEFGSGAGMVVIIPGVPPVGPVISPPGTGAPPGTSVLGKIAGALKSGEWAPLPGFSTAMVTAQGTSTPTILGFAARGQWDAVHRKLQFAGSSHTGGQTIAGAGGLITYDDDSDTWVRETYAWNVWDPGHAYYHVALNKTTGDLYYRSFNAAKIYKRSYGSSGQASWQTGQIADHPNRANAVAGGLEWFPQLNGGAGGLVFVDVFGACWSNAALSAWTCGPQLLLGQIHNFIAAAGGFVYFGGGGGSSAMYRLSPAGVVTPMPDTPLVAGVNDNAAIVLPHPNGKDLLLFGTAAGGPVHRFDGASWSAAGAHQVGGQLWVGITVPDYGVIVFLRHENVGNGPGSAMVFKP